MKQRQWNTLTIVILTTIGLVWVCAFVVFINPQVGFNLFAPPTVPPTIALPDLTATMLQLPPSWTPGSGPRIKDTVSLRASSTLPATGTPVPFNTFTNTPTRTGTPTNTPTSTRTATVTPTRTHTSTATATLDLTATELSLIATSIAETEAAH